MIIERHLRIGNFVARNDSDEFVISEVLGIARNFEWEYLIDSRNRDGRRREAGWISAIKCDPIPLTPEWLEWCGFEKAKEEHSNYYILKLDGVIAKQDDGWCHRVTDVDGYYEQNVGVKIEYVHQLQNRYYSLTGEELQIKMP